jgi:hypothetical protein
MFNQKPAKTRGAVPPVSAEMLMLGALGAGRAINADERIART